MKGDLLKKIILFILLVLIIYAITIFFSSKPAAKENSEVTVRIERIEQEPEVEFIYDPIIAQYSKYMIEPVNKSGSGQYKKYIDITIYDKYFKKYTKTYFGYGFDYKWFKAQAVAESNLAMGGKNEKIRSHVGAQGIMQIMPGTWAQIVNAKMNKYMKGQSVFDAEYNIAAGIYYDRNMGQIWKARRTFLDWMSFIFASYNAGPGNIIKAQRKVTDDPNRWSSVASKLHLVTGHHSKETIGYVDRIFSIKGDL